MVSEQQAVGTVTDPNWIFYPIPDYRAGGGGTCRRRAPVAAPEPAGGDEVLPDAGQYFGAELI
jgi:hypothetical protein